MMVGQRRRIGVSSGASDSLPKVPHNDVEHFKTYSYGIVIVSPPVFAPYH